MSDMTAAIEAVDAKAVANSQELVTARRRLAAAQESVENLTTLVGIHEELERDYDSAIRAIKAARVAA